MLKNNRADAADAVDTGFETFHHRGLDTAAVWNADQVASYLGLAKNTVYEACRRGELPHVKIGKRVLFSSTAVIGLFSSSVRTGVEG